MTARLRLVLRGLHLELAPARKNIMNASILNARMPLSLSTVTLAAALLTANAQAEVSTTASARDDTLRHETVRGDRPSYVRLRSLSYAGSGCPAGSVASKVSADRATFTLLFDSFVAEIGRNVPLSQSRKTCMLSVDLDFPIGWSYAVDTVEMQGYADLNPGVRADISAAYYFQGSVATARLGSSLYGPSSRDYLIRDALGASAMVWSPCGMQRALNVQYSIRLSGTGGSGLLTMDSPIDSNPKLFTLRWKRCR